MSRILVKICGLTSPAMVADAVAAGADAIGLVLAESPRRVTPEQAGALLTAVPPGVERIAVFRAPTHEELALITHLPFDGLQANAEWDGADRLPEGWFFLPVLADGDDLEERARALAAMRPEVDPTRRPTLRDAAFLLDGPRGGGRGIPVDLARAARAACRGPMVLAGGLRPGTVAEAIRRVRPCAVDVSSGVEAAPGVKDPARVTRFVAAVRDEEKLVADRAPTRTSEER